MRALVVAALCAALVSPAYAQTGTFGGTVSRDTLGHRLAQAELELPQLNRSVLTNSQGEFQFSNVPAGRYAVMVRAIGFELLVDSVDIAPGARLDADIVLSPTPVELPAQRSTAATVKTRLPFGIQEMEDRRKTHLGGYFVTDSVLRANEERKLTYFIAKIPGIDQELAINGTGIFLANSHPRVQATPNDDGSKLQPTYPPNKCYIDVFLDGARYFVGPATPLNPPPDFNDMLAIGFSGIEYYSSGATVPSEYNATGSGCGVMLLWTRRTP